MAAHFTVGKDAYMVLMGKIFNTAQAYDLAIVLPSNKVVGKALQHKVVDKLFKRYARGNVAKGKILTAFMRGNAKRVRINAKSSCGTAQERMERGVGTPKDVLGSVA